MTNIFLLSEWIGVGVGIFHAAILCAILLGAISALLSDLRKTESSYQRTLLKAQDSERQARWIRDTGHTMKYFIVPEAIQQELRAMTDVEFEYFLVRSLWAHYGDKYERYRLNHSQHKKLILQMDESQPYTTVPANAH